MGAAGVRSLIGRGSGIESVTTREMLVTRALDKDDASRERGRSPAAWNG